MDPTSLSETGRLGPESRATLLAVALAAIERGLECGRPPAVQAADYPPELRDLRATFVTLRTAGNLRGCIGTCQPLRPLVEDVAHNAFAAAFQDPRFPPLAREELAGLHLHISLLSIPEPIAFASEQDLLAQVRPGVDGLLLEERSRKATLLPAVWEALPEAGVFLRHLKLKAGLPADYWSNTLKIYRYTAESIE
jgi:uncharacterized protein